MISTTSHQARPEFFRLPIRPEFFRLPIRGPDPHFGFTRAGYYRLDASGAIKLVRIRERGKLRGITLVPYDAVAAFIRSQADQTKEAS